MPRYRTGNGVVVNIPEEKAERIGGLTPVEASPSPRRTRKPKTPKATDAPKATESPETTESPEPND